MQTCNHNSKQRCVIKDWDTDNGSSCFVSTCQRSLWGAIKSKLMSSKHQKFQVCFIQNLLSAGVCAQRKCKEHSDDYQEHARNHLPSPILIFRLRCLKKCQIKTRVFPLKAPLFVLSIESPKGFLEAIRMWNPPERFVVVSFFIFFSSFFIFFPPTSLSHRCLPCQTSVPTQ